MAGSDNASSGVPISNEPYEYEAVGLSASGAIIPAPGTGRANRLIAIFLFAGGTVDVNIIDASAGTEMVGTVAVPVPLVSNGYVLPENRGGWAQGAENEAINATLSDAIDVSGVAVFQRVHV